MGRPLKACASMSIFGRVGRTAYSGEKLPESIKMSGGWHHCTDSHSWLGYASLGNYVALARSAQQDGVHRFRSLFREHGEVGSLFLDLGQKLSIVHAAEVLQDLGVNLLSAKHPKRTNVQKGNLSSGLALLLLLLCLFCIARFENMRSAVRRSGQVQRSAPLEILDIRVRRREREAKDHAQNTQGGVSCAIVEQRELCNCLSLRT